MTVHFYDGFLPKIYENVIRLEFIEDGKVKVWDVSGCSIEDAKDLSVIRCDCGHEL